MSKLSRSFRLSPQAVEHLQAISHLTGSSDTAIIEFALAHLAQFLSLSPARSQSHPSPTRSRSSKRKRNR